MTARNLLPDLNQNSLFVIGKPRKSGSTNVVTTNLLNAQLNFNFSFRANFALSKGPSKITHGGNSMFITDLQQ